MNSKTIRLNKKSGLRDPPILVRRGRGGKSARVVTVPIVDAEGNEVARVEYTPDRPLGCGAVVYVRAKYPIPIDLNESDDTCAT